MQVIAKTPSLHLWNAGICYLIFIFQVVYCLCSVLSFARYSLRLRPIFPRLVFQIFMSSFGSPPLLFIPSLFWQRKTEWQQQTPWSRSQSLNHPWQIFFLPSPVFLFSNFVWASLFVSEIVILLVCLSVFIYPALGFAELAALLLIQGPHSHLYSCTRHG